MSSDQSLPNLAVTAIKFSARQPLDIVSSPLDDTDTTASIPFREYQLPGMRVRDHFPYEFRTLWEFNDVAVKDFIDEWNVPTERLEAAETAGRSGSLFIKSNSGRFLMKTIPDKEVQTLCDFFKRYCDYLRAVPSSYLMRLLSLISITSDTPFHPTKQRTVNLLVFLDITWGRLGGEILELYDLKGRKPKRPTPLKAVRSMYRDKELRRTFPMEPAVRSSIVHQLRLDFDFLCARNLMDYSVLVAVVGPPQTLAGDPHRAEDTSAAALAGSSAQQGGVVGGSLRRIETGMGEGLCIGVIDCLTAYSKRKVAANFFKRMRWRVETLSTVPARDFADRLERFVASILVPVVSPVVALPRRSLSYQEYMQLQASFVSVTHVGGDTSAETAPDGSKKRPAPLDHQLLLFNSRGTLHRSTVDMAAEFGPSVESDHSEGDAPRQSVHEGTGGLECSADQASCDTALCDAAPPATGGLPKKTISFVDISPPRTLPSAGSAFTETYPPGAMPKSFGCAAPPHTGHHSHSDFVIPIPASPSEAFEPTFDPEKDEEDSVYDPYPYGASLLDDLPDTSAASHSLC